MSFAAEVPGPAEVGIGERDGGTCPRIALLTPYTGGNLGDAAIQDSMIGNINCRLPRARVSGISLNCDSFMQRHKVAEAFPLLAHVRFSGTFDPSAGQRVTIARKNDRVANAWLSEVKKSLKRLPPVWRCARALRRLSSEIRHFIEGLRFLRSQDLLVVSGGGQLNQEYDGAWRHPFGLFKWAVMARISRVPFIIVSVGVGNVTSTMSRLLISSALRMARYRSYRDENSRRAVACLLPRASTDPIVADLAFSLPTSQLPAPAGLRALTQSRLVLAISPIAIGKPGCWPTADEPLYSRYLREMVRIVSRLLDRGCFLVLVTSCLDEDHLVIPELLGLLGDDARRKFAQQIYAPPVGTWQEYVAIVRDVDLLIASRLHSVILGFMGETPTVAISSGAKVDSVMTDFGQTEFLLPIHDFSSMDVLAALDDLNARKDFVSRQISSFRQQMLPDAASQYDTIALLARGRRRTLAGARQR
jgi:polysaccharide pyruvyl transferase WcaK-like protein